MSFQGEDDAVEKNADFENDCPSPDCSGNPFL